MQEASYWKLDNHVVLQGDLYQSAFYVIPFMIEIIFSKTQHSRGLAYDLLFEIANGFAVEDESCLYKDMELSLTDACKAAVSDGMCWYLEEVADMTSKYRENALDLIISLEKNQFQLLKN